MRFCRFQQLGRIAWGRIQGEEIEELSAAPWLGGRPSGRTVAGCEVRLQAPVEPSKIVCVGRNYPEHAAELGNPLPAEPLLFLKPPSAIIGPEEPIVYPPASEHVDYEGELAAVIGGRVGPWASPAGELDCVFGLTCLNDVTARDLQVREVQFTRAKGFDTFCPVGPVVVAGLDPRALTVETYVNGEPRQRGPVREMMFSLDAIIRFVRSVMTLEPGDLISTGTPPGVGPLHVGDTVEVVIEGIGRLRNPVVAGKEWHERSSRSC